MVLIRFLFGLALGAGAGYLAGRVLAPQSGSQLQADLRARYHTIRQEAQQAAEETRRDLEARYEASKRSGTFLA